MATAEVEEVLARLLDAGAGPQVLVSTVHLGARFDRWVRRRGLAAAAPAGPGGKRRPALTSPFVPPKSELEQLVAGVWRELFGFDEIGVYDDFYELGGHSLLGTQVAVRLRETLRVDLPLRQFLEYTTISELAKAIAARQVEQAEPQDLEGFLAELEAMSDEEATARAD
jgi:acyl carrier protein